MRRVIDRLFLSALLITVMLTTSGCFLRSLFAVMFAETLNEEIELIIASVRGETDAAVCQVDPFFSPNFMRCTYLIGGVEVASTTNLLTDLGVFGALLDPVIFQVPGVVTNAAGTVDNPADAAPPAPLVVTTATSFFTQPGTEIFPEPGHTFLIVDFPASIAGLLTTTPTPLTFDFSFQFLAAPGRFRNGLPVKAMFAGKVQTGGQTYYPPLLPCVTSFANIPTITIPAGNEASLLSQLASVLTQQSLACNAAVYDFRSQGSTPGTADHFQCYKTADVHGNLCAAGSPQNTGGACTEEADCGGINDETGFCVGKGFLGRRRVALSDQFESGLFDVTQPVTLCNPADKNAEGISDLSTHLRGYRIAPAPGQTPHARRTGIRIENQFHPSRGELLVDTIRPDRLLVPTAKSLTAPVAAPDASSHDVDHFKCYTVRVSRGAPPFKRILDVSVADQFQPPALVDLVNPSRLCTPVAKNTEVIKDESGHLMCYEIKPIKQTGTSDHAKVNGIFLNNQIGPEVIRTQNKGEFCIPSIKILP
jgi:hypothetical protein